jgi:hypothetical protein
VQKQLVEAGGTIDPYTFLGAMIAQMDFTFPNQDIGTVKFTYDIGDITTAHGAAALVYPASRRRFTTSATGRSAPAR